MSGRELGTGRERSTTAVWVLELCSQMFVQMRIHHLRDLGHWGRPCKGERKAARPTTVGSESEAAPQTVWGGLGPRLERG